MAAEILDNWTVRKVTFTGSTEVGKHIAGGPPDSSSGSRWSWGVTPRSSCSQMPTRPMPPGAPLWSSSSTPDRPASAPNRLFVHRSMADRFLAELTERVEKLQPGNGLDDGITVGPLIDEAAMAKMEAQVADATGKGAHRGLRRPAAAR